MAQDALFKSYQQNKMVFWGVIFLISIMIFIYLKGKKDGKILIPDAPYLFGSEGIPKGFNPNILADKLHEVMSSFFTLTGTKDAAFRQLTELQTNDMVIAVYNAFNNKYGAEAHGSLTQWIDDENYYDFVSGIKAKALNRLRQLRLT
jgi:hypothetical protein